MTWEYLAEEEKEEIEPIPEDYIWERLRNTRNNLLSLTDHKMVTDAPWDFQPWIEYRQALRDLPEMTKNPRLAEWPEAPE